MTSHHVKKSDTRREPSVVPDNSPDNSVGNSIDTGLPSYAPIHTDPSAILRRAQANPSRMLPNDVRYLQRTIGNRAVARLLNDTSPRTIVQPKLSVGPVNDPFEQEADHIANQVSAPQPVGQAPIQRATPGGLIQRGLFDKKPKRSFDRPKRYNDPDILPEHKKTWLLVPNGADLFDYDKDTDQIGARVGDNNGDSYYESYRAKSKRHDDGTKEKGYVVGDQYWVPAMFTSKQKAKHVATNEPLFPEEEGYVLEEGEDGEFVGARARRLPTVEDVKQGAIGDCWLEAALLSIVAKTPEYILEMMRDNGDTVTVRLFEANRTNPKKPTFKPRYIKVDKSTVRRGRDNLYQGQGGALWVMMIQKAYAAVGLNDQGTRQALGFKLLPSYSNIVGGFSHYAFETLTGRPAEHSPDGGSQSMKIETSKAQNKPKMNELPWSPAERDLYAKVARPSGNYDGLVSSEIFGGDTGKVDRWMAWAQRKKNRNAIYKLFATRRQKALQGVSQGTKIFGKRTPYQAEVRLEHLRDLFVERQLAQELTDPLVDYLKAYFPGKRGTGNYTKQQLEVYDRIQTALENGKYVAASTTEIVGRTTQGVGHSGGESKSKGLAGLHAYAVLDTLPIDNMRYVVVRNPWGSYGRYYERQGDRMKARDEDLYAKMNIELSDFTKRFDKLYVS